jgi:hypothetical protein
MPFATICAQMSQKKFLESKEFLKPTHSKVLVIRGHMDSRYIRNQAAARTSNELNWNSKCSHPTLQNF